MDERRPGFVYRLLSIVLGQPMNGRPVLDVRDLTKYFDVSGGLLDRLFRGKRLVKAVDGISFEVNRNQTLGLVGESGSGKSTTVRLIARLLDATHGEVFFQERDVLTAPPAEMKRIRKEVQIVFQDPFSSLNPRMRVEEIVGRPLSIHFGLRGRARRARVAALLDQVGLSPDHLDRFPHEFSGGQRQRIAIARALGSEPSLLLADEPVSSLDVSVQAQVLDLLRQLRERLQLTMIFISHDLNVAEFIADQVAVMYGGKIMEKGPVERIFSRPLHPYTQSLLEARPRFGRREAPRTLAGEPSIPINPPVGCRFAPRCPLRIDACTEGDIPLETKYPGHQVACIRA
jgi:oligopeptide/dipeptide ABC transporter ATP-binding protein